MIATAPTMTSTNAAVQTMISSLIEEWETDVRHWRLTGVYTTLIRTARDGRPGPATFAARKRTE
jgi:hypothetical protein